MGSRDSNHGTRLVRIAGATPVTDAANVARDFAVANEISGSDLSRLCVIIEELFANLYEHGGVTHDELVEMSLSTGADGVRIIVVDPGRPFDPRDAKSSKRRSERGGGAGIDIVRSWASHVDYRTSEGRNRLELLFPLRGDRHGHADGTERSPW